MPARPVRDRAPLIAWVSRGSCVWDRAGRNGRMGTREMNQRLPPWNRKRPFHRRASEGGDQDDLWVLTEPAPPTRGCIPAAGGFPMAASLASSIIYCPTPISLLDWLVALVATVLA